MYLTHYKCFRIWFCMRVIISISDPAPPSVAS